MDFAPIIADVKAAKCAGFRYQRAGHQRYRDRITVYRDGRLLFERFCYGEAAGLVFKLWAPGADDTGGQRLWRPGEFLQKSVRRPEIERRRGWMAASIL